MRVIKEKNGEYTVLWQSSILGLLIGGKLLLATEKLNVIILLGDDVGYPGRTKALGKYCDIFFLRQQADIQEMPPAATVPVEAYKKAFVATSCQTKTS